MFKHTDASLSGRPLGMTRVVPIYIGPRIPYVAQEKENTGIFGNLDKHSTGDGVRYHSDISKETSEYKKSKPSGIATPHKNIPTDFSNTF